MNNRYAVIENGMVVNIIIWDGVSPIDSEHMLVEVEDGAVIGGIYHDGEFFPVEDS